MAGVRLLWGSLLMALFINAYSASASLGAGEGIVRRLLVANATSPARWPPPVPSIAGPPALVPTITTSPSGQRTVKYTFEITASDRAPDCFQRKVILVSGKFQPVIEVAHGDALEVRVINKLPADWPMTTSGISIHWHGFHMRGFEWYDGVGYNSQCPIRQGASFTYKFQVNESPGTYWFHDHSSMTRGDGLQGTLIVRPPRNLTAADPFVPPHTAEATLFLQDWWHWQYNSMGFRLNRPFDNDKVTNQTGSWFWIGLPSSLLINSKGVTSDCEDVYNRKLGEPMANGQLAKATDLLTPPAKAGQLGGPAAWPVCNVTSFYGPGKACQHEELAFKANDTYLLRLVNAATLVYITFCLEGHSLTLVALDANPVARVTFANGCVDVNSGQRADVIVKATGKPGSRYWITAGGMYRKGSPNVYGVVRYAGAAPGGLPETPPLQPQVVFETLKWLQNQTQALKAYAPLVKPSTIPPVARPAAAAYLLGAPSQAPPLTVNRRFFLKVSQPLFEANGILRWALNNVANAESPPCSALLYDVQQDPQWAAKHAMQPDFNGQTGYFYAPNTTAQLNVPNSNGITLQVLDLRTPGNSTPEAQNKPKAGNLVATTEFGEVVEAVIINYRAGAFGGEYGPNGSATTGRAGREQHPFHLHGHRFWVVGSGLGDWTEASVASYNTKDPVLRDTATLFFDANPTVSPAGWVAVRWVSDNPGSWPMHCHISAHAAMGQQVTFLEAVSKVSEPPADFKWDCGPCRLSHTLAGPAVIDGAYGSSGLLATNDARPAANVTPATSGRGR